MTLKSYLAVIAVMAGLGLSGGAMAQDALAPPLRSDLKSDLENTLKNTLKNPDDYPVLQKLQSGETELFYDYLGEKYGLDAWLLSGPELMQVIYVLPHEKAALVGGTLVNPDGKEASTTLLQNFLREYPARAAEILRDVRSEPAVQHGQENAQKDIQKDAQKDDSVTSSSSAADKAALSPAENFWRNLSTTGGISFGDNTDAPQIFAILDPAQPDTKIIWNVLAPLAEKGHVFLHVVPLAATSADSIMDVAAVLGNKNPQQSWRNLLEGEKPDVEQTPEAHGVLRMKSIVDLAQMMNLRYLPLLVYRVGNQQENHGSVRIVRGTPKDWVALFSEMGMGQPAEGHNTEQVEQTEHAE